MRQSSLAIVVLALSMLMTSGCLAAETFVVRDGKAVGAILTPESPSADIQLAAEELALHLRKMTGAQVPIEVDVGGPLPAGAIRLTLAPTPITTPQRDGSEQAFVIDQTGVGVVIEGNSDIGVLYGAYEYLSDLGVRWFGLGEPGMHVPARKSIAVTGERKAVKPAFRQRSIWLNGSVDWHWDKDKLDQNQVEYAYWLVRNRIDGTPRLKGRNFPDISNPKRDATGHNIRVIYKANRLKIDQHPERFPLVTRDGKQVRLDKGQICFTHPQNIADAAAWCIEFFDKNPHMLSASMSLADTGGVCECPECTKANGGVNPAERADRLIWGFMNEVARRVGQARPGKGIAFYSGYGVTAAPPDDVKAEPNILGAVAHVEHNNHALDDPTCPINVAHLEKFAALKRAGAEMMARDYTVYPACLQPLVILDYIRVYHELGCIGYSCEVMARSEQHWMVTWAQAQLTWNPMLDPRKLIEEYCHTYFGDAGEDVLAVIDAIDANLRKVPKITLGGFGAAQESMTEELASLGRQRLAAAARKVSGVHAQRLQRFQHTFELYNLLAQAYRKLYLALDERTDARQRDAVAAFDEVIEYWQANNLAEFCSPTIIPGWVQRVRNTAVSIPAINPAPHKALRDADHATLVRELFAMDQAPAELEGLTFMPDQWRFRIDIDNRGRTEGWMNPDHDDSGWTLLGYNFFDDQGFLRFEGTFWYRAAFVAPDLPQGKRMFIRIGALDDEGRVYINGKLAHERVHLDASDWKRSFEFDATPWVVPGKTNVIAIEGRNDYGKGGLWKPVAAYVR